MVALFADLDAQQLIERIVARGEERRCLRPLRVFSERTPARDSLARDPRRWLPFLDPASRYLVVWDHQGSGFGDVSVAEAHARQCRVGAGIAEEGVCAVALDPEVEAALMPAWERVKGILAVGGGGPRSMPADDEVLRRARHHGVAADVPWAEAVIRHPKEVFRGLLDLLQKRPSSAHFDALGQKLSVPLLKQPLADGSPSPIGRITAQLVTWFSPD